MGTFHAARVSESPQLQSLLATLQSRGDRGATSLELQDECRIVAVGTRVSELRHNGYVVVCKYERKSEAGAKIYRYRLLAGPVQGDLFGRAV